MVVWCVHATWACMQYSKYTLMQAHTHTHTLMSTYIHRSTHIYIQYIHERTHAHTHTRINSGILPRKVAPAASTPSAATNAIVVKDGCRPQTLRRAKR